MKNIFDRMVTEGDESSESPDDAVAQPSVNGNPCADGSDLAPRTPSEVKEVTQELLKHGYLEEAQNSELFRRAIIHEREVAAVLEPLDLVPRIDSHRGVAFLAIDQAVNDCAGVEAGWAHRLVRRQRLTLEQSLLVALLRQAFVLHEQESGVGQSAATIAVDELLPQFLVYSGDSGSDAKNESRLLNLLDQLKTYGIVSETDKNQEVTIRPLIAHLANPESLAALLVVLKEQGNDAEASGNEE
jgi:hypothetical protein